MSEITEPSHYYLATIFAADELSIVGIFTSEDLAQAACQSKDAKTHHWSEMEHGYSCAKTDVALFEVTRVKVNKIYKT